MKKSLLRLKVWFGQAAFICLYASLIWIDPDHDLYPDIESDNSIVVFAVMMIVGLWSQSTICERCKLLWFRKDARERDRDHLSVDEVLQDLKGRAMIFNISKACPKCGIERY